jgi:NAD(P)-dependent dehydrogenase (short-subunit alcohol dehydrogenase family)
MRPGASKGIGAGIAKALADEGASVVVNYSSSKQDADRVVEEIAARGGHAIAVQGDVSKPAHIERLFSEAKKAYGRLDILVNNAGVYEFSPLEGVTEDLFHKHFNVNVLGLLLTTRSEAHGARGRQHHQHRLGRELDATPELRGVHGDEGRRRRDHRRAGEGARPAEDAREFD